VEDFLVVERDILGAEEDFQGAAVAVRVGIKMLS
jgi:hypothetical protein